MYEAVGLLTCIQIESLKCLINSRLSRASKGYIEEGAEQGEIKSKVALCMCPLAGVIRRKATAAAAAAVTAMATLCATVPAGVIYYLFIIIIYLLDASAY